MLLSIVVPAYNVQDYIKQCIDSCIDKLYENQYEIIVINDGSTDGTEDILKQYLPIKNFLYLKKENGGLSSARNIGLKNASGKYVFFLDSDDYLEKDSIRILLDNCKSNYDMVSFNHYKVDETEKKVGFQWQIDYGELNNIDSIVTLLFTKDYTQSNWSAWGKLYKREIIIANVLNFDENNYGSEDLAFNLRILPYLNTVFSCSDNIVNYRTNNTASITKNVKPKTILSLLEALNDANELMCKCKLDKTTQILVFNNLSMWYLYCIKRYNLLDRKSKAKFKEYKRLNCMFKYSSIAKLKICRLIISLFGIRLSNIFFRCL